MVENNNNNQTRVLEQARQQIADTARRNQPPKKYKREWGQYKKWLMDNYYAADANDRFLTRHNVDSYFSIHVAHNRNGTRNTLKTILYSLRWYSKNREYILEGFDVDSPIVHKAIESSVDRQKQNTNNGNVGNDDGKRVPDPHLGLKDVLPEEDRESVMREIFNNRKHDWGECAVSFAWGNQAAVRGDTTRKLDLSDIGFSRGFGPERRGPRSAAISIILRRGDKNKERRDRNQQAFTWRHRNYLLCSNFSLSLHTIIVWSRLR